MGSGVGLGVGFGVGAGDGTGVGLAFAVRVGAGVGSRVAPLKYWSAPRTAKVIEARSSVAVANRAGNPPM